MDKLYFLVGAAFCPIPVEQRQPGGCLLRQDLSTVVNMSEAS